MSQIRLNDLCAFSVTHVSVLAAKQFLEIVFWVFLCNVIYHEEENN